MTVDILRGARKALLFVAATATSFACTPQRAYLGPGYPPELDSCTGGAEFTLHSDHTWDATLRADCTKHRPLR